MNETLDLEPESPPPKGTSPGTERRTPVRPSTGARRTPRAGATPPPPPASSPPSRLPGVLHPSLLLLLGAGLLVLAWLGYHNPYAAFLQPAPHWPWDLFRAGLDQGGDVVFGWDRYRAVALLIALVILLLVVACILRPSSRRAALAFVLASSAVAAYWVDTGPVVGESWSWLTPAAAALALGAVLRRDALGGGRWPVFGTGLLLAGLVLLPTPGHDAWRAPARTAVQPFLDTVAGLQPLGLAHLFSTAAGWHALGVALFLVLALLTFVGLHGRWTGRVAAGLVLATAFVPPLAVSVGGLVAAPATTDAPTFVSILADASWIAAAAATIGLLATLRSLAGLGRPATVALAGTTLYLLVLVVTSAAWRAGLAGAQGLPAFHAGLIGATPWLGPGLGAMLAPLVAGVLDTGR